MKDTSIKPKAPNRWVLCSEAMPEDFGEDWVLVQVIECSTGFLWIPKIGEFRKHTNSWHVDANGEFDTAVLTEFQVIAWHVLPRFLDCNQYPLDQLRKFDSPFHEDKRKELEMKTTKRMAWDDPREYAEALNYIGLYDKNALAQVKNFWIVWDNESYEWQEQFIKAVKPEVLIYLINHNHEA